MDEIKGVKEVPAAGEETKAEEQLPEVSEGIFLKKKAQVGDELIIEFQARDVKYYNKLFAPEMRKIAYAMRHMSGAGFSGDQIQSRVATGEGMVRVFKFRPTA